MLERKIKLTKFYYKHGQKKVDCTEILKAKSDYTLRMTSKPNDPKAAPKTYSSILNRFLYNKKIPSIPPLLVDNKFLFSDFHVKANLLNDFCSPLPQFAYKTGVKINSF